MSKLDRAKKRPGKPSAPRRIGVNDNAPMVANDHDTPRPVVILLGSLPVISRRPIDALSPGESARIGRIEAALRGRRKAEAARLALEYEGSLGITHKERIAALAPANDMDVAIETAIGSVLASYAEAYSPPPPPKKVKRPKGHKKPKPEKVDPLAGLKPGDLTQGEIDRLIVADQDLKSQDAGTRDRAKRTIANIQRGAEKRRLDASLSSARQEILSLERLRDPGVEVHEQCGRLELSNRDGLESLWIEGKLTDRQRAAGRRYRSCFEEAEAEKSLRSNALAILRRMMSGGGPSGPADQDSRSAWDDVRALEDRVNRSTDKVVERGRRLLMLREVAGRGHTVRASVGASGKAHRIHMLSLVAALDAIA